MNGLILIVEDEADLVGPLRYSLESAGYRTRVAEDGQTALELARQEPIPDLILLDLMLPDIQGTEVCRRLRAEPKTADVPIVMLTAKGEEIDVVVGFEIGADDYVIKPYSTRELLLRIRTILQRARQDEPAGAITHFGRLRVDNDGHRVWVDEDETVLTALEFRLLTTFLQRRGRVQTRDRLLDDVWGYEADVTTRTVDTHIKRLREKLGPVGTYIETLRGVGYRFRPQPDAAAG